MNYVKISKDNIIRLFNLSINLLLDSSMLNHRMIESDNNALLQFMMVVEQILQHGLLARWKMASLIGFTKDYWVVLERLEKLNASCSDITHSVRNLPHLKTGIGKGRAWIRLAIMQKKLGEYFQILLDHQAVISEYYERNALMLNEDNMVVIVGNLISLHVIDCNFILKEEDLDVLPNLVDLTLFLKDPNEMDGSTVETSSERISASEDTGAYKNMLDQKNYFEELNDQLKNQLSMNQNKINLLESTISDMKEKFALSEESHAKHNDENSRLKGLLDSMAEDAQKKSDEMKRAEELHTDNKKRLQEEIVARQECEREIELQINMRQETEMAMKLLEKDIHEKQDTLVSLRQQLTDIKTINLDLYNKLQEKQSQFEHRAELVIQLEEKSTKMKELINSLDTDLKICEQDKTAALETARRLGNQLAKKDNMISNLQADLNIEREWNATLQTENEQFKEEIATMKPQVAQFNKQKIEIEALRSDVKLLKERNTSNEVTLAEMGAKLKIQEERFEDIREFHDSKIWVDERTVKHCFQCKTAFSATLRKHHCRNCGNVFCGPCTSQKMQLPSSSKPERVCDNCYSVLLQRYSAIAK